MLTDIPSPYYFEFRQLHKHRSIIGKLSEIEILNVLGPTVLAIATPLIFPPGTIVWHSGKLMSEEIRKCQWLTFVTNVYKLDRTQENLSFNELKQLAKRVRADYNTFETFLNTTHRTRVFTANAHWVSDVEPQAFRYQSPARQSPYLIRAMLNLCGETDSIQGVLDPMGGYGQTLFECVLRKIDGASLELSPTASHRSTHNLRTVLQRLQIPFTEHLDGNNHVFLTQCRVQRRYSIINGDTHRADAYFPNAQFDTLMTDLPYGVRTGTRTEKLVPIGVEKLLNAALPSWIRLLKPSGTIVFAYNQHALRHDSLLFFMEKYGFQQRFPQYDLSEQISQKIHRNIAAFEKNNSRSHHNININQ